MRKYVMAFLKNCFILSAIIIMLAFVSACADKEDQKADKQAEESTAEVVEEKPELIWSVKHDNKLVSLAVSPDGTVAVGEDCAVYNHRIADGWLKDIFIYENMTEDIEFSRDGAVLGAGLDDNGVMMIDTASGKKLMQVHNGFSSRVAFSPDGETSATGSSDGKVRLWSIEKGEQLAAMDMPGIDWITSLTYNPSGTLLAASQWTDKGTVYIWNVADGKMIHTVILNNFLGNIKDPFQFSPDGIIMAGAVKEEYEHIVRLWAVDGAEKIADLAISNDYKDMDFSPDGGLLAVASLKAVTIWDVSSHELLYTLDQTFDAEDTDVIAELAFTPDGGHVAVARIDGTLEMWRLPRAEKLEVTADTLQESLPSDALFDVGSSQFREGAVPRLEAFAQKLKYNYSKGSIRFIGHTDSSGTAEENLKLSLNRATAISDWFTEWMKKNGADDWTFSADGRGESDLKIPDTTAEGAYIKEAASVNRRIEIEISDVILNTALLPENQKTSD